MRYCIWVCLNVARMVWWVTCVVLTFFQQVSGLDSVCCYSYLLATHDDFKCLICAGDHFVWATVRRFQGTAYGVLPQEDVCE